MAIMRILNESKFIKLVDLINAIANLKKSAEFNAIWNDIKSKPNTILTIHFTDGASGEYPVTNDKMDASGKLHMISIFIPLGHLQTSEYLTPTGTQPLTLEYVTSHEVVHAWQRANGNRPPGGALPGNSTDAELEGYDDANTTPDESKDPDSATVRTNKIMNEIGEPQSTRYTPQA